MNTPKIGNMAPAFTTENQKGEKVSLKDFRDKKNVLLYFYPKASTPGCTVQACGLRDHLKEYDALDTVVLGMSPDPVPRLQKFIDKYDLNFDLLSDVDHPIADKYGIWGQKKMAGREYMGLIRSTFIIGKDGRLKCIMAKVRTKTHHEDALELVRQHCV